MARVCVRHPFQHSDNLCGHCGLEFCRDCIVYPHGPRKPALCVACALAASGVRTGAANRPALSRRELKRRLKERSQEQAAMARLERDPEPIPPITNPFSPGWAVADDALPAPADLDLVAEPATPPPPPTASPPTPPAPPAVTPPPPPSHHEPVVVNAAPTLADLLPSVAVGAPRDETHAARAELAQLDMSAGGPDAAPERKRSLPLLRRREEPVDDGREASEMIAWLDEVFAPRDPGA